MTTNLFSDALKQSSFRAPNGEYGWTEGQVPEVVEVLSLHGLAVLGGELWWVPKGSASWVGLIPQREGPDRVYGWETKRRKKEPWSDFVKRCASDTLAAVGRWPRKGDLPAELRGRILYNLTWVDEAEYGQLGSRKV
jgi:hypothetical protein